MRPSLLWLAAPLGALVVLLLLRRGRSLPAPLRRVPIAGMALLVALGVSPLSMVAMAAEPAAREALQKRDEWRRIEQVFKDVEETLKKGPYPFNEKGKKALLDSLDARRKDADALAAAGAIEAAEAGLLKKELERLTRNVAERRPTELEHATCYEPVQFDPLTPALERLKVQVPLLEKVAAAKVVHPEVLRKVLGTVESDLSQLADGKGAAVDEKKKAEAKALSERAQKAFDEVRKRLGEPPFPR